MSELPDEAWSPAMNVHSLFRRSDDGEYVCLRSTPLVDEEPDTLHFYVKKETLAKYSPVFADMLAIGEAAPGDPQIVQLAEDSGTIALLLSSMSDELQRLPDLVELSVAKLIRLYTASFKYGVVHVQHVAEHTIRCRISSPCASMPDKDSLGILVRHACDFDRPDLLRDAAAAVARHVHQPDDPFFMELVTRIDERGVRALLEEYSRLRRNEGATIEENLDGWIYDLKKHCCSNEELSSIVDEMSETLNAIEENAIGKRKPEIKKNKPRRGGWPVKCNCCQRLRTLQRERQDSWGGGHQSGNWGGSGGAWANE